MGVYLLHSIEPLHLLEPRRLYELCFYLDKYSTYLSLHLQSLTLEILSVLHVKVYLCYKLLVLGGKDMHERLGSKKH